MEKKLIKSLVRTLNGLIVECELSPETIEELIENKIALIVFCNENKIL